METDPMTEVAKLVEEYRDRCLWFLRDRFVPTTPGEALRILNLIERYGDRDGYQRAERLKTWLRQTSSARS